MSTEQLIPFVTGIEYDGSNGSDVLAAIPAQTVTNYSIAIQSETGGTLVLEYDDAGPQTWTLVTGDWLTWGVGQIPVPFKAGINPMADYYIKRSDLP